MQIYAQLEYIFRILNIDLFDDRLPVPAFTFFSSQKKNGWYFKEKKVQYVISINEEELEKDVKEIVQNMLHCMVHEYCKVFSISDTSRNGRYHNKRFGECAKAHGLIIEHDSKEGIVTTGITPEVENVINHKLFDVREKMDTALKAEREKREKRFERRQENIISSYSCIWECPICHAKAKASYNAKLICGYCLVPMNRI